MVNLARIDKNVYKSLGFKNKSIGQTMIKEVLQTKVTNYKTVPALLQHIKPRISNLVNLGLDINDKKMYKQLKSIKKIFFKEVLTRVYRLLMTAPQPPPKAVSVLRTAP